VATVKGWVFERSVRALFEQVSHYIGYQFDAADWTAVQGALPSTDDEDADGWYEYPLVGAPPLALKLARSVGTDVVMVDVLGADDPVLVARIETVIDVLRNHPHGA
jgi:hypothetical protein